VHLTLREQFAVAVVRASTAANPMGTFEMWNPDVVCP